MPSFEELSDLAQFVKPNKIKDLVIVGTTSNPATKLDQLYHGLAHGHFADDAMAAEQVLGCSAKDATYYKLKGRLYEKLTTTFLFIDIKNDHSTNRQRVYHECLRNLITGKILLSMGQRRAAIPVLKRGFNTAKKFQFTELSLAFSKHLRTHFGTMAGSKKKYEVYSKLVKHYFNLYQAELIAEEYYNNLIINFVHSNATHSHLAETAKKYCKHLKRLTKIYESEYLYFITYLVIILRYQIVNDNKNIIKTGMLALSYFHPKKNEPLPPPALHISMKVIASYIQLGSHRKAEELANYCLGHIAQGVGNWYIIMDHKIISLLHSRSFEKAYSAFLSGRYHQDYRRQYGHIAERWKIIEAFIQYLILKGYINPFQKEKSKKFRIKKFLNEVPNYTKDKRGNNIAILILHILFLLHQENYDEIIERVESLKSYSHRYLRQDDTFRSNCFIKMLLQLPAANFHKEAVIRKTKKYWDKLKTVPLEKANQSPELEFIPYETLWEFVLDSLDNKFH